MHHEFAVEIDARRGHRRQDVVADERLDKHRHFGDTELERFEAPRLWIAARCTKSKAIVNTETEHSGKTHTLAASASGMLAQVVDDDGSSPSCARRQRMLMSIPASLPDGRLVMEPLPTPEPHSFAIPDG